MSINDPQWGNSHRPEQKDPEQVPESTGTEPVQPDGAEQNEQTPKTSGQSPKTPPPEGPPDLEALWQQLVYQTRCHLARLFGRPLPPPPETLEATQTAMLPAPSQSTSDENPSPLAGWQALSLKSWCIGVSLIIGAWLVSGFYLVDTPQRGVLSRFGSIIAVEDPGWHWRWPYPIDSVRLINVTTDRTLEIGVSAQQGRRQSQGLMFTADGNLVSVAYAVVYQVTDPVAYLSRADDPADLLAVLAETSLRDAVATQTSSSLLAIVDKKTDATGAGALRTATAQLQSAVDPLQLGVVVKSLALRDVQLPAPVIQAVKTAEREVQARSKALRDAQADSTESLVKARKLAAQLQDESTAYALALSNEAQAARAAGAVAAARNTLTEKSAFWHQQYPLVFASLTALQDRIRGNNGQTNGSTPEKTVAPDAARAPAPASDAWRDRDIMRSRDRVDRPGSGS